MNLFELMNHPVFEQSRRINEILNSGFPVKVLHHPVFEVQRQILGRFGWRNYRVFEQINQIERYLNPFGDYESHFAIRYYKQLQEEIAEKVEKLLECLKWLKENHLEIKKEYVEDIAVEFEYSIEQDYIVSFEFEKFLISEFGKMPILEFLGLVDEEDFESMVIAAMANWAGKKRERYMKGMKLAESGWLTQKKSILQIEQGVTPKDIEQSGMTQKVLALRWFYLIESGVERSFAEHPKGILVAYEEVTEQYGLSSKAFQIAFTNIVKRQNRLMSKNLNNIKKVIELLSSHPKAKQIAEKELVIILEKTK